MRHPGRKAVLIAGVVLMAALGLLPPGFAGPLPNGAGAPVWSPDGHAIAFVSATPNTPVNLWVASWHGHPGPMRRVTTVGGRFLAWTADSKSLLYRTYGSGSSLIYSASLTGGADQPTLTWLPPTAAAIVISADGKHLAYTLLGDGKRNLWVAALDGSNPHQLSTKMNVRSVAWSPDGTRLAFDIGGVYGEGVYLVPATGGEPKLIFSGIGSYPSWSPDGKSLALLGMHSLTIIGADGQGERRLHVSQDDHGPLSWSPDSKYLTYTEVTGSTRALGAVEVATGKLETLAKGWTSLASPRWSPDGKQIAFGGMKTGECVPNLHVLDVATKSDRAVTQSAPSAWSPRLSGDGKALFYISNRGPQGSLALFRRTVATGQEVALLSVDARLPLQLVWPRASSVGALVNGGDIWLLFTQAPPRQVLKTEHPTSADLSPSGDRLIYVKWTQHRPSLVLRTLASSSEEEILPAPAQGLAYSKVAWSPRGDEVAFVRGDTLCRLRLSDRSVTELLAAGEGNALLAPVWSANGSLLALGRFVRSPQAQLEIWGLRDSGEKQLLAQAPIRSEHGWFVDPLTLPYAWSAQGRLAYCLEQAGKPALFVAEALQQPLRATLLRQDAAYPEWTTDDREIICTDLSASHEALTRVSATSPVKPRSEAAR